MLPAPPLLPYAAVLAVATVLSSLLAAAGLRFRDEIGADWFVATMSLITLWNAVALVGFLVQTDDVAVVVEVLSTVLSISVPVVWFSFVLEYSGRGHLLSREWLAVFWIVPAASFVGILAHPYTDLYYESVTLVTANGIRYAETPPGPLAFLALAYIYLLFVLGLWLVVRMITDHDRLYAGQALWLLVGSLVPIALGVLNAFEAVPAGLRVVPAGFAFLGIAYGNGLYRHRLLELTPAARRIGSAEALDDLEEGIIVVDRDWDVVAINESACDQFGRDKGSVLGESASTVHPALERDCEPGEIVDLAVDSGVFEVSTSTVEDARGRLTGYAMVVRDVTRQRGRKQRLEVLNRILRHNLRNHMTVVKGYANEIAAENDGETASMAAEIDDEADELLETASKARAIEQTVTTDDPERRTVDLGDLVDGVVETVADGDASVRTDVADGLTVRTDAPTLELVLTNLVENAVEHAVPSSDQGTDAVEVRARRTDRGVEITVADDGPGVPASELAVLERGTETSLEHSSGLGLWLVNWGAIRLGADLTFDTDDGTVVTLVIPDDQ